MIHLAQPTWPECGKNDLVNPCTVDRCRDSYPPHNMARRRSQHCTYRGFWIRDTEWNRTIVDNFLAPQANASSNTTPPHLPVAEMRDPSAVADAARGLPPSEIQNMLDFIAFYLQIRADLDLTMSLHGEERNASMRTMVRNLVKMYVKLQTLFSAGHMRKLQLVIRDKLLQMCAQGISEAYLGFSAFFSNMCTREIQPWFNFSSRHYTDEHWYSLQHDPVLRPVADQVYYLSGFNRMWRAELGDWQPCYIGCGDIRCREPTPSWGA